MTTRIKLRRDTAVNWLVVNPILAAGEPGLETDTGKVKYGDGITAWESLPHAGGDSLANESSVTIQAGDDTKWLVQLARDAQTFNENDGIGSNSVIYDNDGNIIVHGSISQNSVYNTFIAKYTPAGVCLWKKSINEVSTNLEAYPEGGLAVDSNNNIIVSYGVDTGDYYLLKVDSDGDAVWTKVYANSSEEPGVISGIEVDSNDDIFITTWIPSPAGQAGVSKINKTNGSVIWTKILSGAGFWSAGLGITVDYQDNVVISVWQEPDSGNYNEDAIVAKFDNNGNLLWQKKLILPETPVDRKSNTAINVTSDTLGNIYLTGGYQTPNGKADSDGEPGYSIAVFVTKLNTSGVVQWSRRVGPGPCDWIGLSTAVGADGDLYLSAATVTYSNQLGDNTNNVKGEYEHNLVIARYVGATGDVVWQKYFNNKNQQLNSAYYNGFGGGFSSPRSIDVQADKLVIAGSSQFSEEYGWTSNSSNYITAWAAQLSTDGSVDFDLGDFNFVNSRVPGRRVTITTEYSSDLAVSNGSTQVVDSVSDNMIEAPVSTRVLRSKAHTWTFDGEGNLRNPDEGNLVLNQTEQGYINFIGFEYNDMDSIWLQSVVGDADGYTYAIGADNFGTRRITIYKFDPLGKTVWVTQTRSGSGATFSVSKAAGVYTIDGMSNGGQNYRQGDVVIIDGNDLGGSSPGNDLIIEVLTENGGNILTYEIQSGVASAGTESYTNLEDTNDNGESRPNSITIDPLTGNLVIVGEVYEYNNSTSILSLVVDSESGGVLSNVELRSVDSNSIYPYDVQVNSAGVKAIVGQSYGDTVTVANTVPEATSQIGHMIVGKEGIAIAAEGRTPGNSLGSDWYISGTGITGKAFIDVFNEYKDIPVVTVQGQGSPTFTIEGSGGSYTAATTVGNGGTGGYLPGHKLKVLGSLLGGIDVDNDAILQVITVNGSGVITQADVISGTSAANNTYPTVAATNYQVGSGGTVTIEFDPVDGTIVDLYVASSGVNYTYGDALTIAGTTFAGSTSPANDIRISLNYTTTGGAGTRGGLSGFVITGNGIYGDTLGGSINTDWLSLSIQGYASTDFTGIGAWTIYESLNGQAYIWTPGFQKSLGDLGGNDWFNTVAWQGTSTIYAAGASHNVTSGYDENLIVKMSSTGTVAWKKQITHAAYISYSEITAIATHDDGVVAIGYVNDYDLENSVAFMFKLNNAGGLMWHKQIRLWDDSNHNSTLAIDPATGDILVVQDGFNSAVDWNIIYIHKFDRDGNIIWKRKLFTGRGEGINEDNGYRAVSIAGDSFFLAGWSYWAQDYAQNAFSARLPLDGSGLGEHGIWTYTTSDDDNVRTYDKSGTTTVTDHVIVIQDGDKIVANNSRYYYTDWADPSSPVLNQTVRNGKGGAIVFADGTRQTTSASISQQVRMGTYYTITPNDSGSHIFIDSQDDFNSHYVYIPYWEFVKLPVGFKFSIINRSDQTVYVELEDGPNSVGQIYGDISKNQSSYYRWYSSGNSSHASWIELIKIKEGINNGISNTGPEWAIRGDDATTDD